MTFGSAPGTGDLARAQQRDALEAQVPRRDRGELGVEVVGQREDAADDVVRDQVVAPHDLAQQPLGRADDGLRVVAVDGGRAAEGEEPHGGPVLSGGPAQPVELGAGDAARAARRRGRPAAAARSAIRSRSRTRWPTASHIRRDLPLAPLVDGDLQDAAAVAGAPARARSGRPRARRPRAGGARARSLTGPRAPGRGRSSGPRSAGGSARWPARRRWSAGSGRCCRRRGGRPGTAGRRRASTRSTTVRRPCVSFAVETTPRRLVDRPDDALLRARDRPPVDRRRASVVADVARGVGHDLAADRHAAGADDLLRRAAGGDAGVGEVLREPHTLECGPRAPRADAGRRRPARASAPSRCGSGPRAAPPATTR